MAPTTTNRAASAPVPSAGAGMPDLHAVARAYRAPDRAVHSVFLHCSASDSPAHDSVATMRAWHRERGWSDVGYHFFIRKSGLIEAGRPVSLTPAAQSGHNTGTLAICLHGLEESRFTPSQFTALRALAARIEAAHGAGRLRWRGHREVSAKACPVFDYRAVLNLDANGRPRLTGVS
jgi:N-acetylmuramoyl-L-alanine amidase